MWSKLSRYRTILLFILSAALFLVANRGAYRGYFADDEFDNLALTRAIGTGDAAESLLSPRYFENNFRPTGHFFFRWMAQSAGLNYPPYVAAIQLLHLANIALLWLILRRLMLPFWAAAAGTLVFTFHMAAFDIYWKPAYIFDLLCGTFCLLALLLWLHDRWILSLISFWLAYRSKEIAVMLPLVLAAYELLIGKRRWLRLAPFFLISLWFGIQGLSLSLHLQNTSYSMHYDPSALGKSLLFYASRLFLLPFPAAAVCSLLVLMLIAVLTRDRTVWFGWIAFGALLTPMLLLSEHLFSAYLYVPLIGIGIAIAALATHRRAAVPIALLLALWIPWNYVNLRRLRREALSQVDDRRNYFATLARLTGAQPDLTKFLYFDGPLLQYGATGAIRWLHRGAEITMSRVDSPEAPKLMQQPSLAVLYWNKAAHRLEPIIRRPETRDASYIEIGSHAPVWQLVGGWLPSEGAYQWTRPHATARLLRPENATGFELTVNIGRQYIERIRRSHVEVALNGKRVGAADFDHNGWQTVRWKLDPSPAGAVEVTFDTSPPYPGADPLGSAIVAFGFVPKRVAAP